MPLRSESGLWSEVQSPPNGCSYVPAETASLACRVCAGLNAAQFQELLRRGWRRHGCHLFRPACPACVKCRSLRVNIARFRPTKSQRRCLRRNQGIDVLVQRPTVTADHLRLYNAWHAHMSARRAWPFQTTDAADYTESFLLGNWDFAREMLYLRDGRLIGVSLVDVVDEGLSSVYFFHDPAWRERGPGTFSILTEIDYCRQTGRPHLYLGYWIMECPSMAYKARFGPHEVLERYVADDEQPVWRDPAES
jgi:arginine-tRNA-protein transferase